MKTHILISIAENHLSFSYIQLLTSYAHTDVDIYMENQAKFHFSSFTEDRRETNKKIDLPLKLNVERFGEVTLK